MSATKKAAGIWFSEKVATWEKSSNKQQGKASSKKCGRQAGNAVGGARRASGKAVGSARRKKGDRGKRGKRQSERQVSRASRKRAVIKQATSLTLRIGNVGKKNAGFWKNAGMLPRQGSVVEQEKIIKRRAERVLPAAFLSR